MPRQGQLQSQQSMSVLVNGPDGATTLFITTGLMLCSLSQADKDGGVAVLEETFSALLDAPRLTSGQFRRAIATASLAAIDASMTPISAGSSSAAAWSITSVDADFDDETGGIQLSVDLHVGAQVASVEIVSVGFQVMTSAAI